MSTSWNRLQPWVFALHDEGRVLPSTALPLADAHAESMLPWLAYQLHAAGQLDSLPDEQRRTLRDALRRCGLKHVDGEAELERLVALADRVCLRFLVFKGHSVARTLYPHPACRPCSDFDLLIDPAQVAVAQDWLCAAGYAPTQPYVGRLWLGAQDWSLLIDGKTRFHVDLHWDYTNRMYFRNRLGFDQLWADSHTISCGRCKLQVPSLVDNLVLACVHLAALQPGMKINMFWLLDIYLLMTALDEEQLHIFLQRARQAFAIEACQKFGGKAASNIDTASVKWVLDALGGAYDTRRAKIMEWTMRSRRADLSSYWLRLPVKDKVGFWGDVFRWIKFR